MSAQFKTGLYKCVTCQEVCAEPETLEKLRDLLRRVVNLSHHPYFPTIPDLPAWVAIIQEAEAELKVGQS